MAVKQKLETVLFRMVSGVIRHLPRSAAFAVAESIALALHAGGWRKVSTRNRIREVFPEASPAEQRRIRHESVRNLARNVTELVRGPAAYSGVIEGEQEVMDSLQAARRAGRGVLLVIAHTGNWDLAGVRVSQQGLPMCFIARQQKNPVLYQELIRSREGGGGTVVDRDDPRLIRKLLEFLNEKNGVTAILVDIRARTPGDTFRFLNHPASLANGLGLLAAKSGATIVPVHLRRDGRDRHIWRHFPHRSLPQGCKNKAQRAELLQSCLDDLSAEILQAPESYFWFNKRWVLEPFGD